MGVGADLPFGASEYVVPTVTQLSRQVRFTSQGFEPEYWVSRAELAAGANLDRRESGGDVRQATGFLLRDGHRSGVTTVEIEPPARVRVFCLGLAEGTRIEGTATAHYAYSVAIEGRRRPGALVTAQIARGPLTGQINDWRPDESRLAGV